MNTRELNMSRAIPGICRTHPAIIWNSYKKVIAYRVEIDPPNRHTFLGISEADPDWIPTSTDKLAIEIQKNKGGDVVIEDLRFFNYRGDPYFHLTDRYRIGIGRLHRGEISVRDFAWFNYDSPMEKNWQFFAHGSDLYCVRTITPHEVWRVVLDFKSSHSLTDMVSTDGFTWDYGVPHGGTCPVRYADYMVSVFHSNIIGLPTSKPAKYCSDVGDAGIRRTYFGAAYAFSPEPPFRICMVPKEPLIWPRLYAPDMRCPNGHDVVFPCGLLEDGEYWTCSWGDDSRAFISEFTTKELFSTMKPV